jgi:uncharacterized radical SAM protein YgiQ
MKSRSAPKGPHNPSHKQKNQSKHGRQIKAQSNPSTNIPKGKGKHQVPRGDFLPLHPEELKSRGWDRLDFILISGDAYVDHPSFGAAVVSRHLEALGYRVGLICQPDWKDPEAFRILGRPRLAFLVSPANMDSMVLHYTSAKKKRNEDWYTPGKVIGRRPDRAAIVYASALRQAYKKVTVIIGGIETSLRRLGHYDYWSDKVRRSILLDSKADLAVYGMGERPLAEIARRLENFHQRLQAGEKPMLDLTGIPGTVYRLPADAPAPLGAIVLPSFEEICRDKKAYAKSILIQLRNTDHFSAKALVEEYSGGQRVVQMPPPAPLSPGEFDAIYEYPYTRTWHPDYDLAGGIPALEEVKWSLVSSRGCFGGCSFCSLTFHQGRYIMARSHGSLIREAQLLASLPDFKGNIHDVGGPTANFRSCACEKMAKNGACQKKECLGFSSCQNLQADHQDYRNLLKKLRQLPGVKRVFVRSGLRYDYLLADKDQGFFVDLVQHHVSGQLKVAPEHVSDHVLRLMGKPPMALFEKFQTEFYKVTQRAGKEQYLVPYFISSHPGSRLEDAITLAQYFQKEKLRPQQVQDFYPTPGTLSTCMYYTGLDPRTMHPVFVAKTAKEKAYQRALLQPTNPQFTDIAREALIAAGRGDLIGRQPGCLVPPGRNTSKGQKPRSRIKKGRG